MSEENSEAHSEAVGQNALTPEVISVCKCLLSSSETSEVVPKRKKKIFSVVARTEAYLRERRIPELVRFFLTKILASGTINPENYMVHLLDDCMMFRAGVGPAPVLFEDRHLEAVVKSFDPGKRGWMTAGQVRRAFITVGLNPEENLSDKKYPTDEVLDTLRTVQERELYNLVSAGTMYGEFADESQSTSKV